jgi:hypothetical protein
MGEEYSDNSPDCQEEELQLLSQKEDEGQNNENSYNNGSNLDENGNDRVIRKRKRKSGEQLKALVREFDRNPNWTKDTLLEVSRKTGLSEAQVYKWGWD